MIDRVRGPLTGAIIVVAVVAGMTWWQARPTGEPLDVQVGTIPTARAYRQIKVHVTGAITRPGVYTLNEGSRIGDLIEAAGGPTANADIARINPAARLRDEQQIVLPAVTPTTSRGPGEVAPLPVTPTAVNRSTTASRTPPAQPINLNTATAADLDRVPGIGPVRSRRIVEYRQTHGPFQSVDDLKGTKIIPDSVFEQAREWFAAP
jgi:competence protein ComEA